VLVIFLIRTIRRVGVFISYSANSGSFAFPERFSSFMTLRNSVLTSAILALSCCAGTLHASQPPQQSGTTQTAPDNSKQNKDQSPTADTQPNAKADRKTTAKIRKAIVADQGLSTYGHNVKIITTNGVVTLKGPVSSEDEKQKVAADAAAIIPADKITNELTVTKGK
jgi:hyperosmotically inducible periplasmic protein